MTTGTATVDVVGVRLHGQLSVLCQRCGAWFWAYRRSAKWCPRCHPVIKREQGISRHHYTCTCEICGAEFRAWCAARWCEEHRDKERNRRIQEGMVRWQERKATFLSEDEAYLRLAAAVIASCTERVNCRYCGARSACPFASLQVVTAPR